MKTQAARRFALPILLALPLASVRSATVTWTGTGDTAWSNAANWGGTPLDANPTSNAVTFNTASVPNQATNNDETNLILSSLTFGTTLNQATHLGGNAFTLAGGLTSSTTSQAVSIGNNVSLGADSTWNIARHVTLTGTLTDDGSARVLTKSGNGLLALQGGAYGGNSGSNMIITGGAIGINNANQLSDAWLNLNGGVVVLDGVSWSQFSADRSAGWHGSGAANTWGINSVNGGLAARGTDVNVFINANPAATYGTITAGGVFNRDFRIGTTVVDQNGALFANAGVEISQATVFTTNRTINLAGGAQKVNGAYVLSGPVHEISGLLGSSVAAATRTLTLQGSGNTAGIPILRLSNAGNTDLAITTASAGSTGTGVLILTDDTVVPGALTITSSSPGGHGSGWLALFEGNKTFAKNIVFDSGGTSSAVSHGMGAYAGNVLYQGTATNSGTGSNLANFQWHAEAGSVLTLGSGGTPATFHISRTPSGTPVNSYRKTGEGLAILQNVAHTTSSSGEYRYDVQNGVLRETGSTSATSTQGVYLQLTGGVLETRNALYGAGYFHRTLSTTAGANNLNLADGGWAAIGGPLRVDLNTAATRDNLVWNTQNGLSTATRISFGSRTADNVVEFYDHLSLGASSSGTREFRVTDNPLSANDRAWLSGNISGTANWAFLKSGDGILELTGANTYGGATTVSGGTLRLNGATHTAGGNYTVQSGATLELQGAGLNVAANQFVVNAGGSFIQSGGTWEVSGALISRMFHVNGSGGTIQIAELAQSAGTVGGTDRSVLRYSIDTGGVSSVEFTDGNPFALYDANPALGMAAWASEWILDLNTGPVLDVDQFLPLTLMTSSGGFDLNTLAGQLTLKAWDAGGTPYVYENLAQGQKVYVSGGLALGEYTVQFSSDSFDLVFGGARAIPEPGTMSLIGLALLVLRRHLRKRLAA